MKTARGLPRLIVAVAVVASVAILTGCAGSSGGESTGPTTSFPYLVDPLEPGAGFVQLGTNRYPFDGVICATGPVKSDPEGSTRVFGVYANFEVDGSLAAVSLTRYRNEVHGKMDTIPTITETALVRMQSEKEVRGLAAKRFRVVSATKWQDPNDPTATAALITHKGDRYEAKGRFASVNGDVEETSTTTGSSTSSGAGGEDATGVVGEVAARCPSGSAPTTEATGTTTSVAPTLPPPSD